MVANQEPKTTAPVESAHAAEPQTTAQKPDGLAAVKKGIARTKAKPKKDRTVKTVKRKTKPFTPKAPPGKHKTKKERKTTPPKSKKQKTTLSVLDAAVKVLGEIKQPMGCTDLVTRMLDKGYWKTNGKTPQGTLYAAMLREIQTKGKKSRFKKAGKGKFKLA